MFKNCMLIGFDKLIVINFIFIVVFCCFNVKIDHLVHFLSCYLIFCELNKAQAFSIGT